MEKVYYVRFVDSEGYDDFCRVQADDECQAVIFAKRYLVNEGLMDMQQIMKCSGWNAELILEESFISFKELYGKLDSRVLTYLKCAQNDYLCDWYTSATDWIDKAINVVSCADDIEVLNSRDFISILDFLNDYRNRVVNDDYDSAISCGYGS